MPTTVEIAFFSESETSASLELIRRVLQPDSTSLPHITLRYSNSASRSFWPKSEITPGPHQLVLEAPLTFDSGFSSLGISTLLISCSSEVFETRNYKPDYPRSILHVTLYDGEPSPVATKALYLLDAFDWGIGLTSEFTIRSSNRDALKESSATHYQGTLLTTKANTLRARMFSKAGIEEGASLYSLTENQRLDLLRLIASSLHSRAESIDLPLRPPPDYDYRPNIESGQLAFWTSSELEALSQTSNLWKRQSLKEQSVFITPPELAMDVAKAAASYVSEDDLVDFGDPAAGSGILYAAARETLGRDRVNSSRVVEIEANAARILERRWARTGISVLNADFLMTQPEEDSWSFVLANPPYLRSQDNKVDLSSLRQAISSSLGIHVSKRSDLYVYFLLRAHAWMQAGSLAAWILPAEFQVTAYGQAVRNYLSQHVTLLRMHTYESESSLFDNALTSTSVVLFRNAKPRSGDILRVSNGNSMDAPRTETQVSVSRLRQSARWSFAALTADTGVTATNQLHLNDLFQIRRGIATGANSLFVLSKEDLARMNVNPSWVRPLLPNPRSIDGSLVHSDANGNPVSDKERWVIDTDLTVSEIKQSNELFAEYLAEVLHRVGNRYLVARRKHPFKQEHRTAPPFLFLYMAKFNSPRDRFIRNTSDATYLNNYIGLYPKSAAESVFSSFELLHAALNTIPSSELLRCGRLYGNGLLKLEPRELGEVRISVPLVTSMSTSHLEGR